MSNFVLFQESKCQNGKLVGIATLNNPKALNALNTEMVELLLNKLKQWQGDSRVALVILQSDLQKAFCAGGDVVSMYHAMTSKNEQGKFNKDATYHDIPPEIQHFFTQEYRLDYLIHTYSKPVLVWGQGIIMGGGLGLSSGASHRIVTPRSRIAMPEVSIGLYPDVGGSWFLNKMPQGCGMFLGITGASVTADDALYVGLADFKVDNDQKDALYDSILEANWQDDDEYNHDQLTLLCEAHSLDIEASDSNIYRHQSLLSELNQLESVQGYCDALLTVDAEGDKWLEKAQEAVKYGSPITMNLVKQQLIRGRDLSLAECFKMELVISCRCATFGEFQEGVRALLIDKDNNPNWWAKRPEDVSEAIIDSFFVSPWAEDQHPLSNIKGG